MASFSGFLRKSPSLRLKAFLEDRGLDAPDDFDWDSTGRGTTYLSEVNALIDDMPALQQDRLKAELDHLASLANDSGLLSAEQICPVHDIDLEGIEGVEDILLMLALEHPKTFERVAVQATLNRRTGGQFWSGFEFQDDGTSWDLDNAGARNAFVCDAVEILNLPEHRKREADWYKSHRVHPITGEETEITHATIYVEDRAESSLTFGASDGLERQVFQRVMEVGIACDPKARMVEICAKGGKHIRDQYAQAFSRQFAPNSEPPIEAPRREVWSSPTEVVLRYV